MVRSVTKTKPIVRSVSKTKPMSGQYPKPSHCQVSIQNQAIVRSVSKIKPLSGQYPKSSHCQVGIQTINLLGSLYQIAQNLLLIHEYRIELRSKCFKMAFVNKRICFKLVFFIEDNASKCLTLVLKVSRS